MSGNRFWLHIFSSVKFNSLHLYKMIELSLLLILCDTTNLQISYSVLLLTSIITTLWLLAIWKGDPWKSVLLLLLFLLYLIDCSIWVNDCSSKYAKMDMINQRKTTTEILIKATMFKLKVSWVWLSSYSSSINLFRHGVIYWSDWSGSRRNRFHSIRIMRLLRWW